MCICLYSDLFKLPGNHSIEEPTAGWMLNCSFRRQHVPLLLSSQAHSYLPCQARLPESSFPWSLSYTITFGRREINVFFTLLEYTLFFRKLMSLLLCRGSTRGFTSRSTGLSGRELALRGVWMDGHMDGWIDRRLSH